MSDLLNSASLVMIPSGYKEDTVYSVVPSDGSGDLSFTRASNGTRINSAGLVEVVPWNLVEYSETFDNVAWIKSNANITANNTTAPNGTATADKIAANGTLTSSYFAVGQSIANNIIGQPYTATLYAKAGTLTQMLMYLGASNGIYWNLSNGQFINYYNGVQNIIAYNSEAVGDGWYKYTISLNASSTTISFESYAAKSGDLYANYTTADNYYLWGAQLNIGSTAKPYFPTTDRLNVPRLTYQNGGGGCPSLLLEKQSTNETWYSEDFSQSYWTKQGLTVTANSIVSPDGTQNADLLTLNTSLEEHNAYAPAAGLTITSNAPFTFSCYVKKGTGRYFCTATYFTGVGFGPYATFDLNTATLVASGAPFGTYSSSKIENMGNDWYRCSVTGFGAYTSLIFAPDVRSASSLIPGVPFTGAGETMYVWGAQFEASSYPTSYIPTLTTSSATRVADACSKTGISSLIGANEGSFFVDAEINFNANFTILASLQNTAGAFSNAVYWYVVNNTLEAAIWTTPQFTGWVQPSSALTNGRHKVALAWKANDFAYYLDGVQVAVSTSFSAVPSGMSKIDLANYVASYQSDQKFNEVVVFPTRLTNAELASLTSL